MAAPWTAGAQVRIVGKIHGQDCINVLHFATNQQINDPGAADALILTLLVAVLQCVTEQLMNGVTSDYTLTAVEGHRIAPVVQDPLSQIPAQATAGVRTPTSVSFTSSLVQIRTGGGGRSGRGRMFLPPAGEGETTNSALDAGVISDLTDFIACLAGKFIGAGATTPWRLGVLSRKIMANNPANFDTAFREAVSLVPIPTVAKMGSRKVGHGR